MFQNFIWPVDPEALSAPPPALLRALSGNRPGYVRAVSVLKPVEPQELFAGRPELLKAIALTTTDVRGRLRRLFRDVEAAGFSVDCEVLEDSPRTALLRQVQTGTFDLVLIRSRNAQENGRAGIGGLTADILLGSPIPVCCVRDVDPSFRFRRIVAATDLSATSASAFLTALSLAEPSGAEVVLVHLLSVSGVEVSGQLRDEMHQRAKSALKGWRETNDTATRVPVREEILDDGNAADGIVSFAERNEADLIVIASRGWSQESGAFFGSTARRVVRHARIPVFVARSG
jgi:nucleotide-binding universal stress UspA family protein